MKSRIEVLGHGRKVVEYVFGLFTPIALGLSLLLFSILAPNFLSFANMMNILRQVSFVAVLSIGLCVVMINNDFDLSVAAIMGLSGAICSVMLKLDAPVFSAIVVSCIAGVFLGLINAFFTVSIGIISILSTLALSYMCSGIELTLLKGTWVPANAEIFIFLRDGNILGVPTPVMLVVIIFLVYLYFLERTKYGTYMYAIGGNMQAAIISGINVKLLRYVSFVVAGLSASIASFLFIARIGGSTPHGGELSLMDAFLANFVGQSVSRQRVYNVTGTLIGAIFAGILTNGFTLLGVHAFHMYLIKGVVIIVIVAISTRYKRGVI
jgi:ribose/xylose/arabinose/galactoside ABC-type transport system permease subunit